MSFLINRRHVLGAFAGLLPLSVTPLWATVDYRPGLAKSELEAGKTVFLDFSASWCSTCKRQERVMNKLKAQNPAYEASISFIKVDWDDYGRSGFTKRLKVRRRSILVALKGEDEIGRIVAGTSEKEIKSLMDAALAAATA